MHTAALLCLSLLASDTGPSVHFDTEIIPVLTRPGCNSGACHGAAAGRGGFHFSLLGADPTADYEAIVHAFEGRRVNLAHPENSLILAKPTEQLELGGDVALDDSGATRLLAWIREGARRGHVRRLTSLQIEPQRMLCDQLPSTVPLTVTARFDTVPPLRRRNGLDRADDIRSGSRSHRRAASRTDHASRTARCDRPISESRGPAAVQCSSGGHSRRSVR